MLDLIKHLYTMTGSNVSLSRPEWTARRHTTPLHLSVTAGGKNKQLFVLKVWFSSGFKNIFSALTKNKNIT